MLREVDACIMSAAIPKVGAMHLIRNKAFFHFESYILRNI